MTAIKGFDGVMFIGRVGQCFFGCYLELRRFLTLVRIKILAYQRLLGGRCLPKLRTTMRIPVTPALIPSSRK